MKAGDLVKMLNHPNDYYALVIVSNTHETLIKWLDDGVVEDADNYSLGLEVISEAR